MHLCGFALVVVSLAAGDEPSPRLQSAQIPEFPRVAPTEPQQAAATFECQHGFSMQLVAAEPLLTDPVDLAYDEDGRAYVVEMRDYPFPEEKNAEPKEFIGQVRLLIDDDGDGRMDRSTVFADKLAWPTSVACWKGGVFVAAAPDIWYFKDLGGDGKADVREKVFTGFSRYNVQAIMNNLEWGLDGRLYGAASGNGGNVRPADEPQAMPIAVTRRDFSFDPDKRDFRVESGGERFGNSFDDWGNRFLCNIRNPVQHVVLPAKYLARNPLLAVPRAVQDAAAFGDQLRVYRISPPEAWRVPRRTLGARTGGDAAERANWCGVLDQLQRRLRLSRRGVSRAVSWQRLRRRSQGQPGPSTGAHPRWRDI
jgi:putative membrane-bound dehydrogenase-like protein